MSLTLKVSARGYLVLFYILNLLFSVVCFLVWCSSSPHISLRTFLSSFIILLRFIVLFSFLVLFPSTAHCYILPFRLSYSTTLRCSSSFLFSFLVLIRFLNLLLFFDSVFFYSILLFRFLSQVTFVIVVRQITDFCSDKDIDRY